MDNAHRQKHRYGKKHGKRKSWKDTDHKDWDAEHAKDYLGSDDAKKHQAMMSTAQQLMAAPPPEGGQPEGAGGPGPGAAPPAPMMPQPGAGG